MMYLPVRVICVPAWWPRFARPQGDLAITETLKLAVVTGCSWSRRIHTLSTFLRQAYISQDSRSFLHVCLTSHLDYYSIHAIWKHPCLVAVLQEHTILTPKSLRATLQSRPSSHPNRVSTMKNWERDNNLLLRFRDWYGMGGYLVLIIQESRKFGVILEVHGQRLTSQVCPHAFLS